jgi:NAD(P)-dependent dehydrogenase (short-subunit alcohol dehydrogenase family)
MSRSGRWAVVTGASRNIGRETARALAADGWDLVVCARHPEPLAAVAATIAAEHGRQVVPVVADVAVAADRDRLERCVRSATPSIGALVNNAYFHGSTHDTPLLEVGDAVWDQAFEVNVRAPYDLCRRFAAVMDAGALGGIVNVVAGPGLVPARGYGPYGVSVAGLWMLTRYLAAELAPSIRVNAVCPGTIAEEGEHRAYAQQEILPSVPMARSGRPEEVAGAIRYFLSGDASYTTGALLTVNGGRHW